MGLKLELEVIIHAPFYPLNSLLKQSQKWTSKGDYTIIFQSFSKVMFYLTLSAISPALG